MIKFQKWHVLAVVLLAGLFILQDFTYAQRGQDLGGRGARDPQVWAVTTCTYLTTETREVQAYLQPEQVYHFTNFVYDLGRSTTLNNIDFTPVVNALRCIPFQDIEFYYRNSNGGLTHNDNAVNPSGWTQLTNVQNYRTTGTITARQIRVRVILPAHNFLPTFAETKTEEYTVENQCQKAVQVRRSEARRNGWEEVSASEARRINQNCPCSDD